MFTSVNGRTSNTNLKMSPLPLFGLVDIHFHFFTMTHSCKIQEGEINYKGVYYLLNFPDNLIKMKNIMHRLTTVNH